MDVWTDRHVVSYGEWPMLKATTTLHFLEFPELKPFVWRTHELGIRRLGTLVQMKEEHVFRLIPVSEAHKRLIRERLAVCGLRFGMVVKGWIDPDIDFHDEFIVRH